MLAIYESGVIIPFQVIDQKKRAQISITMEEPSAIINPLIPSGLTECFSSWEENNLDDSARQRAPSSSRIAKSYSPLGSMVHPEWT